MSEFPYKPDEESLSCHYQQLSVEQSMMPPPRRIYRPGTEELRVSIQNREVLLSLPDQNSIDKWMNREIGTFAQQLHPESIQTDGIELSNRRERHLEHNAAHIPTLHVDGSHASKENRRFEDCPDPTRGGGDQQDDQAHVGRSEMKETLQEKDCFDGGLRSDIRPGIERRDSRQYLHHPYEDAEIVDIDHASPMLSLPHTEGGDEQGDIEASNPSYCEFSMRSAKDPPQSSPQSIGSQDEEVEPKSDVSPYSAADCQLSSNKRKRRNSDSSGTSTALNSSGKRNRNIPTVNFQSIIGHQSVKLRLIEVMLPLKLPPKLSMSILAGIRSLPASVLMFGPPGTGKTMLAKAVAGEMQAAYLPIGPSDVLSKYVGESEAAVRSIFSKAAYMAHQTPSKCVVIFFDEIDALGQARGGAQHDEAGSSAENPGSKMSTGGADACSRRVLAELLIQLTNVNSNQPEWMDEKVLYDMRDGTDGETNCAPTLVEECDVLRPHSERQFPVKEDNGQEKYHDDERGGIVDDSVDQNHEQSEKRPHILVLAATNRPADCDPALLRRFGVQVVVGLPHKKDRIAMLKRLLVGIEHTLAAADFIKLSHAMEGWSGSDLSSLTREAAMSPVRECIREAAVMERRHLRTLDADRGCESGITEFRSQSQLHLEKELTNLRPVTINDYLIAMEFWMMSQMTQETNSFGSLGYRNDRRREHYDSSSDEEDEG